MIADRLKATSVPLLLLSSLLFCPDGISQQLSVSITPEFGSFRMSDMKDLQSAQSKAIRDSLGTTPEAIYNFRSWPGLRASIGYRKEKSLFSLSAGMNTTGSRLYYEDYSGFIQVDKRLSTRYVQFGYHYSFLNKEKLIVFAGMNAGLSFSTTATENNIVIHVSQEIFENDEEYHEQGKFKSTQVSLNPQFTLRYLIFRTVFIECGAGYLVQVNSSSQKQDNTTTGSPNSKTKDATLDWSGFRLNAGIGFTFTLKKS